MSYKNVKDGMEWYQPTYSSVYHLSINQETLNYHDFIRSNVVVETVPRPVQISELLENGLFYTNTGEKAVPAQVNCISFTTATYLTSIWINCKCYTDKTNL